MADEQYFIALPVATISTNPNWNKRAMMNFLTHTILEDRSAKKAYKMQRLAKPTHFRLKKSKQKKKKKKS